MKRLLKILGVTLICVYSFNTVNAQTAKADKKAARSVETSRIINAKNYIFNANYVLPLHGGGKQLSGEYSVSVSKNKLVIYLPYFGRAYIAPMDASDGGIKLNTIHFDYKAERNKKGNWDVVIKPKDRETSGSKDVQLLRLSISADGYASLQVTSLNRESISFNGTIEEQKKEK
ncbi:DUF4251 domain-containing protein [Mucilaginibacter sp.]|uniref:DUF4251 domain-containing protein n=1 Tax=Mucilaginibacter sp. TaxID=1882438 RepID=UPI0026342703|nr:DUF4251 domain-containing protein [Mucilaginibacter sp.]MDB4926463.1 hypothetical protein [Mucilaginibacter sp.]